MSQGSQASPRQQGGDSYSNMYLNKGQTSSSLVPLHNPVPKKNVAAKVPHLNTTALPIDLAFQELHSVSEIPAAIRAYFARQEAAPKGPTSNRIYGTITGIRLCYNELSSIAGLFEALAEILEDPAETLQWLDLSNNKLTRIEAAELVKFPNLSSLNLHGNHISSLKDVKDLGVLSKLSKFTIHNNTWTLASDSSKPGAGAAAAGGGATAGSDGKAGDKTGAGSSSSAAAAAGAAGGSGPDSARDAHGGGEGKERAATYQRAVVRSLESAPFYREQLIWYLKDTLLKSLDNNPITVRDREGAVKWHSVHRPVKKEAAQDGEGA